MHYNDYTSDECFQNCFNHRNLLVTKHVDEVPKQNVICINVTKMKKAVFVRHFVVVMLNYLPYFIF
jgi:hypothetical protein